MKKFNCLFRICSGIVVVTSSLTGCVVNELDSKNSNPIIEKPKYPGGVIRPVETKLDNAATKYQNEYDNKFKAVNISIDTLNKFIKNCPECDGIRIYRTINDGDVDYKGAIGIVVVGIKDKKEVSKQMLLSYDRCPDNCDTESVLYKPIKK